MNIGEAAAHSGLPSKTIRYYEEIGLVVPHRQANGYRRYLRQHVLKLCFIQRARSLGFGVEECRQLLSLYEDESRASADVKALAEQRLHEIDRKIRELQGLRITLSHLVDHCRGDSRPDCPILEDLAQSGHGLGASASRQGRLIE